MPIVVQGPWSTAVPVPTNKLIDKVCRLYGLQDDSEARAFALDCLDETIQELNTHLFEFNKVTETGLALTADVASVQLSSPFYKESVAYLVDTSGKQAPPLVCIDWITYQRLYTLTSPGSTPEVYSMFNIQSEGKVYLGPRPSASVASGNTLTVEYYRRIPIASETDQLTVPQEIENVLLNGAKKRFSLEIAGPDATDWRTFEILEQQSMERLTAIDKRHPDMNMRFRVYNMNNQRIRPGRIYIEI